MTSTLQSVLQLAPHTCPIANVKYEVQLSPAQLAALAHNAGFRGTGIVYAVAIALAESGGYVYNCGVDANGTVDMGLWQLNSAYHSAQKAYVPSIAAAQAYAVSNHGSDFGAWCSAWRNPGADCGKPGLSAPQPGSPAAAQIPLALAAAATYGVDARSIDSSLSGLAPANNPVATAIAKANPLSGIASALSSVGTELSGGGMMALGVLLILAAAVGLALMAFKGYTGMGDIGAAYRYVRKRGNG